jgi:hypothetical protein
MKLQALHDAVSRGVKVGALIHDRTGVARPVEVVAVGEAGLMAVARVGKDQEDAALFGPNARVRVELPQETSVVHVPGRVAESRRVNGAVELEIECLQGAEDRQRRMNVRVTTPCRIRLRGGEEWDETRTVNISAGGALVANGGSARAGDVVEVEMDLMGEAIRCRAEVVRRGVKTNGVSSRTNATIRFLDMPPDQRDRIALHVLSTQAGEKAGKRARR